MIMSAKKYLTAFALLLFFVLLLSFEQALSDVTSSGATENTQSTSGSGSSNTAITGGYESSTTYQSGSSSNTSNSTTNNNETETAVNSASAPSMSVYSQDSCSLVISGGVTVMGVSFSGGGYIAEDPTCVLLKKVRMMKSLNMNVAAISLACQDESIWKAMAASSTWCPIDGLIGESARKRWEEVGGFHRVKVNKYEGKRSMTWNNEPVPSGGIKTNETVNNNNNAK